MNNVKLERIRHELLQKDVAEYLKINVSTYRRKENTISEFTAKEVKDLARKYNCTTDHLLEGI